MPEMDQISQEASAHKSTAEKVGAFLSKPVRAPLGMAANYVAKQEMLGNFKSHQDLAPPEVFSTYQKDAQGVPIRGGNNKMVDDLSQMQISKMSFQPQGGSQQTVEGWVLPPKHGNPTIVFFGGSDFDRGSDDYKAAITSMAYEAKDKNMGFAVFDYPEGVNEKMAKQYVNQLQQHLEGQGIAMDKQAYAGYSQGSFLATYAAQSNNNAAGLHITSGFSSARMAQKDKMQMELEDKHIGAIGSLIEKRQLTEVWDNIPLAEDIGARRAQQQQDGNPVMPVSAAYDDQELFGRENNRHMTPLVAALTQNAPDARVQVSSGKDHLEMLKTGTHLEAFKSFANESRTFANDPNRIVVAQAQNVQAPSQSNVRNLLRGVSDRIDSAKETLKAKLGLLKDEEKLGRLEKQIAKRETQLDNLLQERKDLAGKVPATSVERQAELKTLQAAYDPTAQDSTAQIDAAERIDELKRAEKVDSLIEKNTGKIDGLKDKKQAQIEKMELRANRQENAHKQENSVSMKVV